MHNEAIPLWSELKSNLLNKRQHNKVFQTWLESLQLQIKEDQKSILAVLQVPSELHKKWAQDNLLKELLKKLNYCYNKPCSIRFELNVPQLPVSQVIKKEGPTFKKNTFFNSEYTFETFIVGKHNEFAHGACVAIAEKKTPFNPLFIYGPSGLGKTHLLNAIGQNFQKQNPKACILYLSAERFLNECIQSIQHRKMAEFRKKYRKNVDLLLMDDIQMIAKGVAVQEEFFHTFNDLYHKQTPVVVCCDKFPQQISGLENRIRTRLDGGLVVDISYPDLETRLAILKHKTNKKGLILSSQVMTKIAKSCQKSIREMEGVLNKIKMMGDLLGGGLSFSQVEKILENIAPSAPTVEDIQKKVAEKFNVEIEEMLSNSRMKNIVTARQTAMFFIKQILKKSLNDVGRLFGGKDHTTVLNSLRKINKLKEKDPYFKRLLENIQKELQSPLE